MKATIQILLLLLIISVGFSTNTAFGHGLGGEIHPPVTIGDRNAVLSIEGVTSIEMQYFQSR